MITSFPSQPSLFWKLRLDMEGEREEEWVGKDKALNLDFTFVSAPRDSTQGGQQEGDLFSPT
jgi:hypothetical protein